MAGLVLRNECFAHVWIVTYEQLDTNPLFDNPITRGEIYKNFLISRILFFSIEDGRHSGIKRMKKLPWPPRQLSTPVSLKGPTQPSLIQ